MKFSGEARSSTLEDKAFLLLLISVSVAFLWVLWPFAGALFWAGVFALVFSPLHFRFFKAMPKRRTTAALLTLAVILVLVILPVGFITVQLVKEAGVVYQQVQSGDLSFSRYFQQIFDALPGWLTGLLERFGMNDLGVIQQQLSAGLKRGSQFFATQALNIGQNTFDFLVSFFVMLYLLFFLLRDGGALSRHIEGAVPLEPAIKRNLSGKFTTVIRATVRGNLVVAMVQGAIGGVMFWILGIHGSILWGTLMALLSLLPAGAAVVWGPVAVYFLVTGAVGKGLVLFIVGALGIGLIDNFLRPLLVGKDTKMPDYVVLVSTLGGMALFGLSGFVIGPVVAAMFMAVWDIFAKVRLAGPADTPMQGGH